MSHDSQRSRRKARESVEFLAEVVTILDTPEPLTNAPINATPPAHKKRKMLVTESSSEDDVIVISTPQDTSGLGSRATATARSPAARKGKGKGTSRLMPQTSIKPSNVTQATSRTIVSNGLPFTNGESSRPSSSKYRPRMIPTMIDDSSVRQSSLFDMHSVPSSSLSTRPTHSLSKSGSSTYPHRHDTGEQLSMRVAEMQQRAEDRRLETQRLMEDERLARQMQEEDERLARRFQEEEFNVYQAPTFDQTYIDRVYASMGGQMDREQIGMLLR
jgi:hypothetical protein